MAALRILIVEDDPDIAGLLAFNLGKAGYETVTTASFKAASHLLVSNEFSLVLLDLMLPDGSGIELCKTLRATQMTARLPVLMLTALGAEADILAGFEAGADDYVTKPFNVRELLARLRAILKRSEGGPSAPTRLSAGELILDAVGPQAWLRGEELGLTWTEFKLLRHIVSNPWIPFSREELLEQVWGYSANAQTRTVDVHVRRLRAKLGDHADVIETAHGTGYGYNMGKYGKP